MSTAGKPKGKARVEAEEFLGALTTGTGEEVRAVLRETGEGRVIVLQIIGRRNPAEAVPSVLGEIHLSPTMVSLLRNIMIDLEEILREKGLSPSLPAEMEASAAEPRNTGPEYAPLLFSSPTLSPETAPPSPAAPAAEQGEEEWESRVVPLALRPADRGRRHPRYPLEIPMDYQVLSGPLLTPPFFPHKGTAEEIGREGLRLVLPERLPALTVIRCTLHLPAQPVGIEAEVVWSELVRSQGGTPLRVRHGVRFRPLAPEARLAVNLFLSRGAPPRNGT